MKNVQKGKTKVIYTKDLHYNVPSALLDLLTSKKIRKLADLGSGYGYLLYTLSHHELLPECTTGIEKELGKCSSLKNNVPEVNVICADILEALKPDGSFDLVINEQVIEHIHDQDCFLKKIHSLLKEDGSLYISSIVRRKWAWWFYRYKGKIRLNPNHVREYESVDEFVRLLTRNGFVVIKAYKRKFIFHLFFWIDILLVNLFKFDSKKLGEYYDGIAPLRILRRHLGFFIPGFYVVEAVARKSL